MDILPASALWSRQYQNWLKLGFPLRPCPEDVALFSASLATWQTENPERVPRGLVLGVTPEIYTLPWPDKGMVKAIDNTPAMIQSVWPGPIEQVIEADWRALPLASASIDVAFCDGGLHLLDFPDGQSTLAARLADVVAPGGLVVLRLFLPSARAETVDQVIIDLLSGAIRDLNCLKLRLIGALTKSASCGVVLGDVYDIVSSISGGSLAKLAERLGWDEQHLSALESYRGSPAKYYLANLAEVLETFVSGASSAFSQVSITYPQYVLGDRTPVLTLRRH